MGQKNGAFKTIEEVREARASTSISTPIAASPTTYFRLVTLTFASWNHMREWLRRLKSLRHAA